MNNGAIYHLADRVDELKQAEGEILLALGRVERGVEMAMERVAACESAIAGQVVERDERTDSDSLWHGRIVALEQRMAALEAQYQEALRWWPMPRSGGGCITYPAPVQREWDTPEEDAAWAHLDGEQLSAAVSGHVEE